MAIAKKPHSNLSDIAQKEAKLDEFITGKGASTGEKGGKRVPALIRFEPSLLRRVDAAAKKRGVSRAAWLQFVVSRALDAGEG
jgi:hypothetical protein